MYIERIANMIFINSQNSFFDYKNEIIVFNDNLSLSYGKNYYDIPFHIEEDTNVHLELVESIRYPGTHFGYFKSKIIIWKFIRNAFISN